MGSSAACGGVAVAESVVLLACPLGPIPLAARGLAAVLARAGPRGRARSPSTRTRAAGTDLDRVASIRGQRESGGLVGCPAAENA